MEKEEKGLTVEDLARVVEYLKQENLVDLTDEQVGKMALDLGAKKKGK